jgi:hypothetical protein
MSKNLSVDYRAVIIGWNLGKQPGSQLSWLYSPHVKLNNVSPKEHIEAGGDIELVEKVFCDDFNTTLEYPDFTESA